MTRRQWAVDLGVALLTGVFMTGIVLFFPRQIGTLLDLGTPALLAVVVLSTVVLVFRRRAPVAVTVVVALLSVLFPGSWFGYVALYSAGAYARRWTLWLLAPLVVAASFVGDRGWVDFRFNDHAFLLFVASLVTLAGLYVGTRREAIAGAVERADRAEREQELLAEQARADERVRLAGEMHDVVTHRINLMVLQAGALGVRSDDPAVHDAAEDLRRAGVQALAEMRDLVGVLRAGRTPGSDAADVPADELEGLDGLIGESRRVGVDAALEVTGDPAGPAPTVRRTLHRVVQEALTNARKHAPGAAVRVGVRHEDGRVCATITNGPADTPAVPDTTGGGVGLDGLRRRVGLVGGTFAAGPTDDGGFRVAVVLPADVPTGEPA
ncbi:signal transduction histidine kinase [Actinomycetospora succinea]|uniref:histidine kinase n=1 Tax=Actinomycetospora succinea TaxID=663603 RepID=A0A4R6VT51_9PSEU|nr:histidine kinase [Actinomycetospora succinea]TDQ63120.1 signal transduction histidine kinase [Actinomycetospora succinea]